jgi:hypothetical protein
MPPLSSLSPGNSNNDDRYDYSRHRSLMQINVCDWLGESGHLQFHEVMVTMSASLWVIRDRTIAGQNPAMSAIV